MPGRRRVSSQSSGAGLLLLLLLAPPVAADELADAGGLLDTGRYRECLQQATANAAADPTDEAWSLLRLRALLAVGEVEAARAHVEAALAKLPRSIRLRLLAREVFLRDGAAERADQMLREVALLGRRYFRTFRDAASRVVIGRARLLLGEDAKAVMDGYFVPAKHGAPELVDPRIAIAELALAKHDYALAAEEARAALALEPEAADHQLLLARALGSSDPEGAAHALGRALALNPFQHDALLLEADQGIGRESYVAARAHLDRVLAIDPGRWEAWAYLAVLAHLAGDEARERECRATALDRWPENPGVDHLIGRELSEKYRFSEGAARQRRALELDPEFGPARFQLAQDLLHLGEEREGWRLADEALRADEYNVVAYNLMVLHDVLADYATLAGDGYVIRMEAHEAEVYGARVQELMAEALGELCARYELERERPTMLELFEEQKDFAIRTFGLPGGEGFLGVCFGDLVTMKSPASQGERPSCWEAVLWHELCHVVTLNKTRNRMPRWLSEGISVWEERRRDPAWGQTMNPEYRAKILAGGATPVSALSSAFLSPDGQLGLQFAYYESSMVVEYLVATHGFETLVAILDDLGAGVSLDASLTERCGTPAELDAAFAAWFRALAESFAPDATWEPIEPEPADPDAWLAWAVAHPNHALGLQRCATALVAADRAGEARPLLERAVELCPTLVGAGSAYPLLARILEESGDVERELEVLRAWTRRDADTLPARRRLMELLEARSEWDELATVAAAMLAVQPTIPAGYRTLARAAEALGHPEGTLRSGRALLALDPVDPAEVHLMIARASAELGDEAGAKRAVLRALEAAPRYRPAHRLLLELVGAQGEAGDR